MKRGEVWWGSFDPAIDGEMRKRRPAIIVSNDAANYHLDRVKVIPLTSNVDKLYPSETLLTFRSEKAKAMADQLTTVSKKRLINSDGTVSHTEMEAIARAIITQLGI